MLIAGLPLGLYYLIINIVTFIICGLDKYYAASGQWRIKESSLLIFSAIGGALGMLSGMFLFRHKTRKLLFRILVPLFVAFHAIWALLVIIILP